MTDHECAISDSPDVERYLRLNEREKDDETNKAIARLQNFIFSTIFFPNEAAKAGGRERYS